MIIKKRIEERVLNQEMTLLKMDNQILDVIDNDAPHRLTRDKNSIFSRDTEEHLINGDFCYQIFGGFINIRFRITDNEADKKSIFDIYVKVIRVEEI